jgi:phosphatidylserine/phosphatidylglycerophosphate/cardiolipin synthase-like enzyme
MIEGSKRGLNIDVISNGVDGGWGEAGHQLRLFALKLRRKGKPGWAGLIEKLDKVVAVFIGRSNRKNLANAVKGSSVDVWLYFNHIHAKQMSFDHIMTSTGSFNLDQHSYKNHESTMICLDKKLADESLVSFVSDIVNATPIIQ